MSKKTFNVTDLTKEVYGNSDTNSGTFETNRKRIERHIKGVQEMLGQSRRTFEAPIDQLDDYVLLIKNLLDNPENNDALKLNRKMINGQALEEKKDNKALKSLIKIVAEAEHKKLIDQDKELFEKWLEDQLSDNYYIASEKNLDEVMRIVKNDFSLFDDLNSLASKLEFQEKYMNDIRMVSSMYRLQVEEQLLFEECFLEIMNSHPDLNEKTMYTMADFLELPPPIQQEIRVLIEKKRQKPSEL
ncbi:hypothetical protein [Virgibacillus oceani]|uniref:Uncharacterized protein n=1 Tax=Virgibacillus oceani TaxID=1479511 RepID=A0A917M489_9BACI|nr:hypothetical protein [Virgibacillus oceani]GGG76674.1 hypothetical protein GCM10011398_22100 [Virgibacillus oceani]